MTGDARWVALFDRIALFLTLLAFLLRAWVSSAGAGTGLNLFIHLLFWVALTLWFAGRATSGGGSYRFSGFEFAFLAFAAFSLLSVLRARYKLTAIDHALAYLSLALFFVLCIQVLGRQTLISMLFATVFAVALYAILQRFFLYKLLQPEAFDIEMARRIRTMEPSGPFLGPNQLAGFLVLTLPPLIGSMLDTREYKLRGAALALGLVALVLTGSMGGAVSIVCGGIAFAALALTRTRGRGAVVAAGGAAVAVVLGLLLWSPLLSSLDRNHSMHVRAVYWRASGKIVSKAPILGVGLDNWQEHYFHAKSDVQQESMKAHNDYLQILAETGIFGLLSLAAILALGLRKGAVRDAAPDPDVEPPSPWLIGGVVGVLVLLSALVGTALALVPLAAWFAFLMLMKRLASAPEGEWTRIGATAGLAAFMVHMTADFQIYEFGIAASLVAVLALLTLLRGRAVEVRLPRGVCIAATGLLLALCFPMLMFVTPAALAADNEIEDARTALRKLESGSGGNPTLLISDAIRVAESAQQHNPYNPEAYQLFARAKFHEWDLLQKAGARDTRTLEGVEGTVLQALENAIAVRPLLSPLHFEKSQVHRQFRRFYLKSKDSELARAKAAEHLRQAVDHQRRAYDLYPTFSRNAYRLARLLEIARDPEAPRYYKEALHLSDLAGKELENLDRMKLDPISRARALRSIGKALQAHEELDRYFRDAIKGQSPADARLRLERFLQASSEDVDEGMTPVLKDVVDAILRDLK